MKRVIIVHGWGGSPSEGWFPWLKKELEKNNFLVKTPKMPETDKPKISDWTNFLKTIAGQIDGETYFVGHSIGCQTILRLMEKEQNQAGAIVLVAPWVFLSEAAFETSEDKLIAAPWLENPINFANLKSKAKKYVAIFSSDDPLVPLEQNLKVFKDDLGAEILIEKNKGHFSGDDDIVKLPSALNALLEITK